MAIIKYRDVVQDAAGNAISGATVTILDTGTATPSTLYQDDNVTPLANPLTSDATGGFEFSIEEGTYDFSVARTGYTTVVQDRVTIGGAGGGAVSGFVDMGVGTVVDMSAGSVFYKNVQTPTTLTATNLTEGASFLLVVWQDDPQAALTFGTGFSNNKLWDGQNVQPKGGNDNDVFEFICLRTSDGSALSLRGRLLGSWGDPAYSGRGDYLIAEATFNATTSGVVFTAQPGQQFRVVGTNIQPGAAAMISVLLSLGAGPVTTSIYSYIDGFNGVPYMSGASDSNIGALITNNDADKCSFIADIYVHATGFVVKAVEVDEVMFTGHGQVFPHWGAVAGQTYGVTWDSLAVVIRTGVLNSGNMKIYAVG